MSTIEQLRSWASRTKRDAVTLWMARTHPQTPRYAKALAIFVVAYALSPIDLIPDFIPVLGYLDDVILLPVLIWLTVRMLPPTVLDESRVKAERWLAEAGRRPTSRAGATVIVAIWIATTVWLSWWLIGRLSTP